MFWHPTRHTFAIFVSPTLLSPLNNSQIKLSIADRTLAHRIYTVLRLSPNDTIKLFNHITTITLRLTQSPDNKKLITGIIEYQQTPTRRRPHLIAGISLLKRDAFENAVYHAAQIGATTIVPIITAKSRKVWYGEKEQDRLEKIIIAACEQSKNFVIPDLMHPQELPAFIRLQKNLGASILYFEQYGTSLATLVSTQETLKKTDTLTTMIGPEGGFSPEECTTLDTHGATRYTLTPTVLRSHDAVCLGLGVLSSILYKS